VTICHYDSEDPWQSDVSCLFARLYRNIFTSIFFFIIPWRTKTHEDGWRTWWQISTHEFRYYKGFYDHIRFRSFEFSTENTKSQPFFANKGGGGEFGNNL
jgi:hypothetical protein